ncbi:hypothetical protein TcCL_ESM11105 [Trypanosoma cruzi]|nr:hypothetical protein TcCL_ESM11105 [Trypanosoma cruzi]
MALQIIPALFTSSACCAEILKFNSFPSLVEVTDRNSVLPQIVNTVACRWIHPPSDPLQGVKVHRSTLRRSRQSSFSSRNATRRLWVRQTMLWPSEKMVVCRPSPATIVPTAPSPGAPTSFHQRCQFHPVIGNGQMF